MGKDFALSEYGSFGENLSAAHLINPGSIVYKDDGASSNPGSILVTKTINALVTPKISTTDNFFYKWWCVEFSHHMADTKFGHACFTKKFHEFAARQHMDTGKNSCHLKSSYNALINEQDGSIKKYDEEVTF